MFYKIRPGFRIILGSSIYLGGDSVDLSDAEFKLNKHKLEEPKKTYVNNSLEATVENDLFSENLNEKLTKQKEDLINILEAKFKKQNFDIKKIVSDLLDAEIQKRHNQNQNNISDLLNRKVDIDKYQK